MERHEHVNNSIQFVFAGLDLDTANVSVDRLKWSSFHQLKASYNMKLHCLATFWKQLNVSCICNRHD